MKQEYIDTLNHLKKFNTIKGLDYSASSIVIELTSINAIKIVSYDDSVNLFTAYITLTNLGEELLQQPHLYDIEEINFRWSIAYIFKDSIYEWPKEIITEYIKITKIKWLIDNQHLFTDIQLKKVLFNLCKFHTSYLRKLIVSPSLN